MNASSKTHQVNTTAIVNNREGKLLSNTTMMLNNSPAFLLRYIYKGNNFTTTYNVIEQNGKFQVQDPVVWLSKFTVHKSYWIITVSGTSYNIYLNFSSDSDAASFVNFVGFYLTLTAVVQDIFTVVAYSITGTWIGDAIKAAFSSATKAFVLGAIAGVGSGIISDLTGTTSPLDVYNNLNGLFKVEESSWHSFQIAFTLNMWEYGLVPQFSVWGWEPGHVLYQAFNSIEPLTSVAAGPYQTLWNDFDYAVGTNNHIYISDPSNGWGAYVP